MQTEASPSVRPPQQPEVDWAALVQRIHGRDQDAIQELYSLISGGMRFLIIRQLGSADADDKVHDVFIVVLEAIYGGRVLQPDRLIGFIHTIVRRQIAATIGARSRARAIEVGEEHWQLVPDRGPATDDHVIEAARMAAAVRALQDLRPQEQEILRRFYLLSQSPEAIQTAMGLSSTQFRIIKSRAKKRLELSSVPRRNFVRGSVEYLFAKLRPAA